MCRTSVTSRNSTTTIILPTHHLEEEFLSHENDNDNNNNSNKEQRQQQQQQYTATETIIDKAASPLPPWHSLALLGIMTIMFCYTLPKDNNNTSISNSITLDTFLIRPTNMSLQVLGGIRVAIAIFIWCVTIYAVVSEQSIAIQTTYLPGTKLQQTAFNLGGYKLLASFTVCCWNLLGLSFFLSGIIPLIVSHHYYKQEIGYDDSSLSIIVPPILVELAAICWHVAAPTTMLISTIVKYAIWPTLLQIKGDTLELRSPQSLMMHNLNIIFALIEICCLGGLPIHTNYIGFVGLFGCAYAAFTWLSSHLWTDKQYGPQYLYFFLDPTLGLRTSIFMLALLAVLLLVFCTFMKLSEFIVTMGEKGENSDTTVAALYQGLAFIIICALSCRLRD